MLKFGEYRRKSAGSIRLTLLVAIALLLFLTVFWSRRAPSPVSPASVKVAVAKPNPAGHFQKDIKPILQQFCFDCHADGMNKGNMSLDEFKDDADMIAHKPQWLAVLKNVRA